MAEAIFAGMAALFLGASAIVTVVMINTIRGPRPLGEKKPMVTFLPKYLVTIRLPAGVTEASDPGAGLEELVAPLGFKLESGTKEVLQFGRGSLLGDFSIKIAKVYLRFRLPLSGETQCEVAYGFGALFDTGDLWRFANELKDKLESRLV